MKSVVALALKDLRLLLRDKPGFFFVFFFPLIYAVFFGTIFSGEGGGMGALSIAVVDEDQTEASRRFVQKLEESKDELSVRKVSREEAVSLVRRGKLSAYVILPEGFGLGRDRLFQGEGIRLEVGVDPSRKAEAGILQGLLMENAFSMIQDLFGDRSALIRQVQLGLDSLKESEAEGVDTLAFKVLEQFLKSLDTFLKDMPDEEEESGEGDGAGFVNWEPVKVSFDEVRVEREGPKTSFDITMPQAFVWAFMGCAAAFGISLVVERTGGTLLRLRCAPIRMGHILAGKALACFITIMACLIMLTVFFCLVFKVRPNSYALLAMAYVVSALSFVGVMMLISVLGKTEASAGGIGWGILVMMAMLGGGMVPLAFMPSWMQTVSHISIVKWAVLSLEGAIWRDYDLTDMLLPCAVLLGIGAACFTAGVRLFKD